MTSDCHKGTQIFYRVDLPRHCLYKAVYPDHCPIDGSYMKELISKEESIVESQKL